LPLSFLHITFPRERESNTSVGICPLVERFAISKLRVVVVDGDRAPERPLLVLNPSFVVPPVLPAGPRLRFPVPRFRRREGRRRVRYRWERDGGGDRVRGVGGRIAILLERTAQNRIGRSVRLLGVHLGSDIGSGCGGSGGCRGGEAVRAGQIVRPRPRRRRLALLRNRRGAPQDLLTLTVTACAFG